MADSPRVHHYYYSAHHLAGDFIWGVGIFSLFVGLGAILFPDLRFEISSLVGKLDALKTSSIAIFAGVFYTLIGAAAAVIAQRAAQGLRDIARRGPSRGEDRSYQSLYQLRGDELKSLYDVHFPEAAGVVVSSNDMVNRLIAYMKLYNPEGYSHVHRTYTIVALFRQSIFFTVVLLFLPVLDLKFTFSKFATFGLLALLFVTFVSCLRLTLGRSVAAEFDFIFGTGRWVIDQQVNAEPQPHNKRLQRTADAAR